MQYIYRILVVNIPTTKSIVCGHGRDRNLAVVGPGCMSKTDLALNTAFLGCWPLWFYWGDTGFRSCHF